MIRVLLSDPTTVEAEALIRSVGTDLEACTPIDRRAGSEAGSAVLDRLRAFGEVPVGGALVTPGGDLPIPFLIHLVVRSSEEPVSEETVARAFRNGLRQAAQWELARLSVPPLGIGAGNLDAEVSARVMCSVLREHLTGSTFPREVAIVVANAYERDAFTAEISRVLSALTGGSSDASAGPEPGASGEAPG